MLQQCSIMLKLCSNAFGFYYAQNYASRIRQGLEPAVLCVLRARTAGSRDETMYLLNKTLGRAQDPHANGAWLSKLTE